MADDLFKTLAVGASGLRAQRERMRVIAENMANSSSLPRSPGEEPYRRKLLTFRNQLDRVQGVDLVRVDKIRFDQSPFSQRFDPVHPGAGPDGYVSEPNVNILVESMDMREARRTYEANLNVIEAARAMMMRTIGILN